MLGDPLRHLGLVQVGHGILQVKHDRDLYALRNLVERCFSKLKHSRRLATRYDKTADSYLGFVLVASIRLWVRHFVNRT